MMKQHVGEIMRPFRVASHTFDIVGALDTQNRLVAAPGGEHLLKRQERPVLLNALVRVANGPIPGALFDEVLLSQRTVAILVAGLLQ